MVFHAAANVALNVMEVQDGRAWLTLAYVVMGTFATLSVQRLDRGHEGATDSQRIK